MVKKCMLFKNIIVTHQKYSLQSPPTVWETLHYRVVLIVFESRNCRDAQQYFFKKHMYENNFYEFLWPR